MAVGAHPYPEPARTRRAEGPAGQGALDEGEVVGTAPALKPPVFLELAHREGKGLGDLEKIPEIGIPQALVDLAALGKVVLDLKQPVPPQGALKGQAGAPKVGPAIKASGLPRSDRAVVLQDFEQFEHGLVASKGWCRSDRRAP